MVGTPPNYENPMCVDAVWLGWLDAYMNKTPYKNETTAIGFSYMLVGDIPVDNDDPFNTDEDKNTWVQEGPHLMLLVPQGLFGDLPRDPYAVDPMSCGKAPSTPTLWCPGKDDSVGLCGLAGRTLPQAN